MKKGLWAIVFIFLLPIIFSTPGYEETVAESDWENVSGLNQIVFESSNSLNDPFVFGSDGGPKTLLVTSEREEYTEPFTTKLAVWLRAVFSAEVRVIVQGKLDGEGVSNILSGSEIVIYYGIDYDRPPSSDFIDASFRLLASGKTKLVWIGYHGDKLKSHLEKYGIQYLGLTMNENPPNQALYLDNGVFYQILNKDLISLKSTIPRLSRSRIEVNGKSIGISAKSNESKSGFSDFYFFGFHPTAYLSSEGIHLVFLDLMHEAYGVRRDKYALIRLEDVCSITDSKNLKLITRYLCRNNKPFTISLIPFYISSDGKFTPLRENMDLIKVIKDSLRCGGEVVLHGATHQYRGETGVDSEFWDEEKDMPIDDVNYIRSRVELALEELEATGLLDSNIGWETPHNPDRAGEKAFDFFESRFDLLYENPHWNYDLHLLPYPLIRKRTIYIPTNLGYYHSNLPMGQIDDKLKMAEKINKLRYGGVVSFFYHPWLGIEKLESMIDGFVEQGWEFALASSVAMEYSAIGNSG